MLKEVWEVVCQSAKINLLFTMEYVIKVISSISLLVSKALLLVLGVSFHGNNIWWIKRKKKIAFHHFYTCIHVFKNVFIIFKIVNKTGEFSSNFGKIQ